MLSQIFSEPFNDPSVRHSLAAVLALALSAGPVGVFLMLRRMSLVGDAMSHAILPGVAIGFLAVGLNVFAMTLGGLVAGLVIALLAGAVSRATALQEDASLAVFLLVSLAFGVVIVTINGIDVEQLMEFLFGETAAKMNVDKLLVIAVNATISVIALALIYRPLALDCVDPGFLRSVSRAGGIAHLTFLALLVLNLISAFHALGTLLGIGIIIIPAAIARFWTRDISVMIVLAIFFFLVVFFWVFGLGCFFFFFRHRAHRLSRRRQDHAAQPHPVRAARPEIRRHRQRIRRDRHRQRPHRRRRRGSVRDEQRLHLLHRARRPDPHHRRADAAQGQVRRHHRRDHGPRRPGAGGADLLRRRERSAPRPGSTPWSRSPTPNG